MKCSVCKDLGRLRFERPFAFYLICPYCRPKRRPYKQWDRKEITTQPIDNSVVPV